MRDTLTFLQRKKAQHVSEEENRGCLVAEKKCVRGKAEKLKTEV